MTIEELPFDTFKTLNYLERIKTETDKRIPVYERNTFLLELVKFGYLEFHEEDTEPEHITHYKFYRLSDKYYNSDIEDILKDITGLSLNGVIREKVIDVSKTPFFDCSYVLDYIVNGDWSELEYYQRDYDEFIQALNFHGFTDGSCEYEFSPATDRLRRFVKDNNYYGVIEILTGKSKEENLAILEERADKKNIDNMFELAERYGYVMVKKGISNSFLGDAKNYMLSLISRAF